MRDLARDFRMALRGLVRGPAYSAAVIATLAVGIGANTAIFSVFNWILFRPVPGVAQPHEMATIRFLRPKASNARFFASYRDVADLRDGMPALSGLAASAPASMNVVFGAGVDPQRIEGEIVTADYFDVLGVTPQKGRRFLPAEEHPGAETASAVISDDLWRRSFASAGDVLGRQLTINSHPFSVVGVAPREFHGRSLLASTDLWIPVGAHMTVLPSSGADLLTSRRRTLFADAFGRLRPGATFAQAQEQASGVARNIPDYGARRPDSGGAGIVPTVFEGIGHDTFARERLTTVWRLLAGAVGLMLLLACANAANLLLARAIGRRREIAVCQAIGASRLRLIRQQLAEGVVLSLSAGAAGAILAQILTSAFDGMRIVNYLPAISGVTIDWRVGVFTLAVATVTGALFSLAPAFVSSRVDLQASLKDGITSSRRGGRRLRSTLVAVQVAISVLLLVSAGLFVRTLHNIRTLDLGLNLDGLVTFASEPTKLGYNGQRAHAYFLDLLARLRSVPGIEGAAFSWRTPYSNIGSGIQFARAEGGDNERHVAENNTVSAGYFKTLGTRLLAGRDFTDEEFAKGVGNTYSVVIVNKRLASEVFPGGNAVGSYLVIDDPRKRRVEIVGVVEDIRGRPVTNEPEPCLYIPGSIVWGSVNVRSSMPFAETAAAIRDVARATDPELPPYDIEPMAASVQRVISEQRLFARLSALFAAIAALLAGVGIYGMMAGAVAERRREFGIRLALGAHARGVLTLVLRGALPTAIAGLIAGLAASLALRKVVASRLFGVTASDPLILVGVTLALLMLALTASFIPALRASRVDPVQSLRME